MKVCKLCGNEFPIKQIINGKEHNLQSRLYCLECSPFGKHNTKQLHSSNKANIQQIAKICSKCKLEKDLSEFYNKRDNSGTSRYCKKCAIEQVFTRQRNFKIQCINYLGDKCEICDYSKCADALEFHHINPSEKEFCVSKAKCTTFSDKIKSELDKCQLLCANCHRETHSNSCTPGGI